MSSLKQRIGMIVPSLNTIGEDDFRKFCPPDIQYYVHRIPSSNTMVAIKRALAKVGAKKIVHVCPFADRFSSDEKASLEASGFEVLKSVGLNFVDAKEAARMEPDELAEIAKAQVLPGMDAILLSCANVRAFEAVAQLEQVVGLPVITSNQAVLWDALNLIDYTSSIAGGGLLWKASFSH